MKPQTQYGSPPSAWQGWWGSSVSSARKPSFLQLRLTNNFCYFYILKSSTLLPLFLMFWINVDRRIKRSTQFNKVFKKKRKEKSSPFQMCSRLLFLQVTNHWLYKLMWNLGQEKHNEEAMLKGWSCNCRAETVWTEKIKLEVWGRRQDSIWRVGFSISELVRTQSQNH